MLNVGRLIEGHFFFSLTTAMRGSVWHIVSEYVAGLQTHLNGTLLTSTNF